MVGEQGPEPIIIILAKPMFCLCLKLEQDPESEITI